MIINPTYFSEYLDASKLTISRLDDPLGEFWLKDWFNEFIHRDRIFVHSFPQNEIDIDTLCQFCFNHQDFVHIIILCGQSVPLDEISKLASTHKKVFVLNDFGHSSEKWFPMLSAHRTFGKGYIGQVPFVPWTSRKYTLSALSSRYEPHRWIILSYLHGIKRKDFVYSFHNVWPVSYDLDHFIKTAKSICNYEVTDFMIKQLKELMLKAPIVPEGMSIPRPDGKKTDNTHIADQSEIAVYLDSKININLEGQFVDTGYGCNITEKTMKSLACGNFPLHVGQSGFYKFLSSMGFNFDTGMDLSYDEAPQDNRVAKLNGVINLMKTIEATPELEKICRKNYEWFHNGWYDSCEANNRAVLDLLQRRVYEEV